MDAPVAVGDVLLDKYRVERVLGIGGMGAVVAVQHVTLGQLYAIKFLLPKMLMHQDAVERFLREARASARLQSDHVARVHDVGTMANGAPYMVMEYLDGCDLKVHLARQGPLSIDDAVTYLLHVCDAIAEAHAANIVHRDLKPANLFLVRRRNGSPLVKVLDFGISKYTGYDRVDLTNTDMSLGTPLYMSPEQMSRTKAVDERADIWALGVILYELLTATSPFRAATMPEIVANVLQEEPRPLRDLRPDVPAELEAVIARCLRKRRDERFGNVEELVQALERFVPSASASRLPLPSVTKEDVSMAKRVTKLGTLVLAPRTEAPVSASISTPPVPEPTGINFGQTGTPIVTKRERPRFVWAALGGALLLVGVGWAGWRSLSGRNQAQVVASVAPPNTNFIPESASTGVAVAEEPASTRDEAPAEAKNDVETKPSSSENAPATMAMENAEKAPDKPKVVTPPKVVTVPGEAPAAAPADGPPATPTTAVPPPKPTAPPPPGQMDEAALRRGIEGKVWSGRASEGEIKLLIAICKHQQDVPCRNRAIAMLKQKQGG